MSAAAGITAGAQLARGRLTRRPTLATALLGASLVVVAALVERHFGSAGAVDRTLEGTFRLVVPLVSFAVVAEASGRQSLRDAVWPIARYGLARRDVALGVVGAALISSAVIGAVLALLAVAVAHAQGNPPFAIDAFTSAWIAALTASAYAAWFSFGASFGRRGGVRWIPLLADLALGGAPGVLGALLPRAHAISLLGGPSPMGLSQPESCVVLLVSAIVLTLAAALRCGD